MVLLVLKVEGFTMIMQHQKYNSVLGIFVPQKFLKVSFYTGDECFLHLSQAQHSIGQKQADFTSP